MEHNTPRTQREEYLHRFAIDPLTVHRKQASLHPDTHIEDLLLLLRDRNYEIRHNARNHQKIVALYEEVSELLELPDTLPAVWRYIAVSLYLVNLHPHLGEEKWGVPEFGSEEHNK